MFLYSDPQIQLDLYRHRADELMRQAAEYRRARSAAAAGTAGSAGGRAAERRHRPRLQPA